MRVGNVRPWEFTQLRRRMKCLSKGSKKMKKGQVRPLPSSFPPGVLFSSSIFVGAIQQIMQRKNPTETHLQRVCHFLCIFVFFPEIGWLYPSELSRTSWLRGGAVPRGTRLISPLWLAWFSTRFFPKSSSSSSKVICVCLFSSHLTLFVLKAHGSDYTPQEAHCWSNQTNSTQGKILHLLNLLLRVCENTWDRMPILTEACLGTVWVCKTYFETWSCYHQICLIPSKNKKSYQFCYKPNLTCVKM